MDLFSELSSRKKFEFKSLFDFDSGITKDGTTETILISSSGGSGSSSDRSSSSS